MIWFNTKPIRIKIEIILICHLVFYDGERRFMARKKEPIIIDSIFFNYVGTDEQFNVFLKSVIKDYISEDKILPDDENIDDKKSA